MAWTVPFVDFPLQFAQQEATLMPLLRETLAAGDLIMRRQMLEFEEDLAAFVGVRHAVGVSNCTDGLRLLAHAFDAGPGTEVVSVAHTFVATVSPFHLAGAEVKLVDIGDDHLMAADLLPQAVSERTRFIVPVHLNGRICDMAAVQAVADGCGAIVIEDAAQALGATLGGRRAGGMGRAGVFSFYPAKLLGAFGDAGAVVTDDGALAEELRLLRDHGRRGKDELARWGYNCRLDNLQAVVLSERLRQLPAWIERRRELAGLYDAALRHLPMVSTLPGPDEEGRFDVYQNYPIEVEDRAGLVAHLRDESIEILISWPVAMHRQEGLGLGHHVLPRTEQLSAQVLSLPLFPELTDAQIRYVADAVEKYFVR